MQYDRAKKRFVPPKKKKKKKKQRYMCIYHIFILSFALILFLRCAP